MQIRLEPMLQLSPGVPNSRSRTFTADGPGWIVRRLRSIAGLTQAALAERLECSRTRVTWIESGRQTITTDQLDDIATACGLELTLFVRRAA